MTFYVGQKVVCIDDRWQPETWVRVVPNRPIKDKIYTIRSIVDGDGINKGKLGLWLIEIHNQPIHWEHLGESGDSEPRFTIDAFRPLVERKTDISIFQKMLTGNKVHENS